MENEQLTDEEKRQIAECEAAFKRLDEVERSLYWVRRMKKEIEEDKKKAALKQ
jgi:hypothetical protein